MSSQLTQIRARIHSFVHLTHLKGCKRLGKCAYVLCGHAAVSRVRVRSRADACVSVCSSCAPVSVCTQLPPAIFSDWAWPGFLLPCFLLCIPNYGGEFLGRTTRIARFGLISSLNWDISRLQPFDQHRLLLPRASRWPDTPTLLGKMRDSLLPSFFTLLFDYRERRSRKYRHHVLSTTHGDHAPPE